MGDQTPRQLIMGSSSRPTSPRPLSANSHRSSGDEKEKKGLMLPPPVPVKTNKGQEDKPVPYVAPYILRLHSNGCYMFYISARGRTYIRLVDS